MAEMFELAPAGVALLDAPAASLAPTCPSDGRFSPDAPFDAPFSPDPFAEWDPFDLLGPLDRLRDPGEFIASADIIDTRPPFDTSQFIDPAGSIDSTGSIRTAGSTTSDATIADTSTPPDAMTDLRAALDAAEQAQQAANRAMAAHLGACRTALDVAARNAALYLHPGSLGDRDASELAVRAAATELSMRLHLPVGTIRNRAHEATVLHDRLPRLWAGFAAGTVTYTDARVAVDAAAGFPPGDARLRVLDDALADVAGTVTTARFRQRAKTIRAGLDRDEQPARHARAFTERRVIAEYADDGMGWLNLYTSQVEIAKIMARIDATARRDAGTQGETRTLDQLRADTATAWLTGAETPTAARAEIIITVPLLNIARTATATATATATDEAAVPIPGTDTGAGAVNRPPVSGTRNEYAMLDGVGPIDDVTALKLLGEASSFLRLATDPITAAPLALDRTRYRPTRAQRLWLALVYERCTRAACNRPAISTDLDHRTAWTSSGGPTNTDNLCPLCRSDHVLKHCTLYTQTLNSDQTITWTSPTGRSYTDPPPF